MMNKRNSILRILKDLEKFNKPTFNHSLLVGKLSYRFGKYIKLSNEKCNNLLLAGLLHDTGKLFIPNEILNKPSQLTDWEYQIIKTHTELGSKYLTENNLEEFSKIARYHHERWDGKGYKKIIAKELNEEICTIIIADSVAAMYEDRTYRKGKTLQDIYIELDRCSGYQFNPDICLKFRDFIISLDSENSILSKRVI